MTEEEIRPIAENYVEEYCHCSDGEYTDGSLVCAGIGTALIVSRQLEKRIEELEEENKVLAQNLEDTEILNKTYEKKNKELKTDYEVLSCSVGDFDELQNKLEEEQRKNNGLSDNLTKAKELLKKFIETSNPIYFEEDRQKVKAEAEQFLNSEVEK
jgi:hypothetical protein